MKKTIKLTTKFAIFATSLTISFCAAYLQQIEVFSFAFLVAACMVVSMFSDAAKLALKGN